MSIIRLVEPNSVHKEGIRDFKDAFPVTKNGIEGTSELAFTTDIAEWISQMEANKDWKTIQAGWVPGIQYLAVIEGTVVGMLNLRLSLNDYLLNYSGHIGYSVRPSCRGNGYGSEMLRLALVEAKKSGLTKILVTCADDNSGSVKVIENNHGIMEDKRLDQRNGQLNRRYWFDLTK